MLHFRPCKDRSACTEDGVTCRGCGRTHAEILLTRELVADIVQFIGKMNYDNSEEFMDYIKRKVMKKTRPRESIT
jgi:predicted Fe-S protein YdhL (DUF1289 family)